MGRDAVHSSEETRSRPDLAFLSPHSLIVASGPGSSVHPCSLVSLSLWRTVLPANTHALAHVDLCATHRAPCPLPLRYPPPHPPTYKREDKRQLERIKCMECTQKLLEDLVGENIKLKVANPSMPINSSRSTVPRRTVGRVVSALRMFD